MLVSEFDAGEVAAYEIDPNGDPVVGTRRTFADGLTGAEGALLDARISRFQVLENGTLRFP